MVPDIAKKGHSFNGAFAYYLHDKRQEGELRRDTAERVAWTETRNLAVESPDVARRVMIATASQADALKKAAGVKAAGRKSTQHVYAYSLAWHPDEGATLDRAEMIKAVDASLKVLGADHLQAVIVCHRDQKHPHVHVIVNRVDPTTGKMHGFSNDRHQLDAWSHAYEQARGRIVTPNRDQKFKERAQARPAERRREIAPQHEQPKSKAAALAQLGAAQKDRHAQEWKDLTAAAEQRRRAAWADRPSFKAIAAQHRVETRPQWSEFGKMMATERRAFQKRERDFFGIVINALAVATSRPIRGDGTDRGLLAATFAAVLSSHTRREAFDRWATARKAEFVRPLNQALDAKIATAKREHADQLTAARKSFEADRAALVARQDLERVKIRKAWKQIYLERDQAAQRREHADTSRARVARQTPQNFRHRRRLDRGADAAARSKPIDTPQQENPAMRREFDKSRQLPLTNQFPERSVSAPVPTPAPSPSGTAPAPTNQPHHVPDVDKVKEWAKTPEGQRVSAPQKAAPDNLRTAAPAAYRAPASPEEPTPAKEPAATRDYWNKAAEPPKPQEPVKARDYWDRAAKPEKPTPTRDRSKDRDFDRER